MSGQLTRLSFYSLLDDRVEFFTNEILVPPTNTVKFSISLTEHGPPVETVLVNPGSGFPLKYFGGWLGLDPSTTYWIRGWIEDPGGTVIADSAHWVSTFPAGSTATDGPPFNSCGTAFDGDQDRVKWGGGVAKGPATSPTILNGEVA